VLLIIPALATGVVANFDSFGGALAASLVIGIAQSEITLYVSAPGWDEAVPFLLVILVLVLRGQSLPLRSHVNEVLPEIGAGLLRPVRIIAAVAVMVVLIIVTSDNWSTAITTSIIAGIICVSLVVVTGYAGQLSLAQYAFAGCGGYLAARLAAVYGLPFPLVLVIGVAAAVPVGVLVGLPALRTRGIQLAIATFGLAYSLQSVLFQSVSLTGGLAGTVVASPTLFGWNINTATNPKGYALVCLAGLLVVALAAANIRRGRSGRRLVAVRGNERAAASLGISVYGAKLYAFALSAAIAGLGGVLAGVSAAGRPVSQSADPTVSLAQAHRVAPRVLEVRDICVSFGGVRALAGVSLEVHPGEVVGIMGPNGAGKTTFIDAVTGFTRLRGGTIALDGQRIGRANASKRARLGIGRTFQSLELFDQLTVLENLRTASDPRDSSAYLTDLAWPKKAALTPGARSAIAMFGLVNDLDRVPSELPYGRRRQVAIARAIAAEPSILLLDEPAAGLHESETVELGRLLRRLADEWGIGILLVEHDVPLLNQVCDRLVVMDFGSVIATGTPADIRKDPRVVAAYLGEEHSDPSVTSVTSVKEEVGGDAR